MKVSGVVLVTLCSTLLTFQSPAQEKKPDAPPGDLSTVLNDMLKTGDDHLRVVSGHWYSTKDPTLRSRGSHLQQVTIRCMVANLTCTETSVSIAPTAAGMSPIQEIKDEDWNITTWDSHKLIASHGDDASSPCQRHVLTMNFDSGGVTATVIPTHRDGCEAFAETESYGFLHVKFSVPVVSRDDMYSPRNDKPKE